MRGRDFIFDCVYLLYYNCHKINFERSGLYIDSLDWIKNEKATINPINNKDNKFFQYVTTVTLNHEEIGKHPEKVIKVKHFRDKYNWEGINYPSEKDDCKRWNMFLIDNAPLIIHADLECLIEKIDGCKK